ncbi:MAG: hypothetical protein HDR09_21690, partial [Lachnospiraceae bacterium]|nr:hypothetical protein [Lachnospiraceae bacterium]
YGNKWVYGDLRHRFGRTYITAPDSCAQSEIDPSTVGQYVGLCDYNLHDIYEGDILSIPGTESYPEEVIFKDGSFQVNDGYFLTSIDQIDTLARIIIGNIHENRNLLTRGIYEQDN